MFHKELKLTYISGTKSGTEAPQGTGSKTLFYPISIMPQIYIEYAGNLKHPKNLKTNNTNTGSHLVSCRVIPRSEREVF